MLSSTQNGPGERKTFGLPLAIGGFLLIGCVASAGPRSSQWKQLRLEPQQVALAGPGAAQHFVVTGVDGSGNEVDVTGLASVTSSDPESLAVDSAQPVLHGRAPGKFQVRVALDGVSIQVPVEVRPGSSDLRVSFSRDIASILTQKGCNGSGCHGSPAGQNGFKLSLYGDDLAADYKMILHEHDGRRVNLGNPPESLLLKKPTFAIAHGGGHLITPESERYKTILDWLEQGADLDDSGAQLTRLEIYPSRRILVGRGHEQRMAVLGRLSDGSTRDMTAEVRFVSGDETVVQVGSDGFVHAAGPGLTTVMARAMGKVATSRIGVIQARPGDDYPDIASNNFIDDLVFAKLREMNERSAAVTTDREFARRVYLDAVGMLPTPDQLHRFLNDSRPNGRARLIDELLDSDDYTRHWLVKFEDWFRNNQLHSQGRSMGVFKDWVRDWIAADRPYDEVVRELLTSTGDTMVNPAANFWHPATDFMLKEFSVIKVTPSVTRLFLGVRIECAECHNHPLENFTQDDFYGFAAFFSRLGVKHGYGEYRRTWYLKEEGEVEHPVTKEPVAPKFLAGRRPELSKEDDRRQVLADWIVSPENPFFARATVNRIWHEYFQTGIVEPPDDFRSTNAPSNPELLDRLADYFIEKGYRFKSLHRLILNSRTYQLKSEKSGQTPLEKMLFASFAPRQLPSEVLLDTIVQTTGVDHVFLAAGPLQTYPKGTSAKDIYLPDGPDYFLQTFGTPRRDIIKDRAKSPTLAKSLHMMNGKTVRDKIEASDNVLGKLIADGSSDAEIAAEIYERAYSRAPTVQERETLARFLSDEAATGRGRRRALENVLWAVLNSKEFQLNY